MRATIMQIDKNKFIGNIEKIQKYIGNKKIIPVMAPKCKGFVLKCTKKVALALQIMVRTIKT